MKKSEPAEFHLVSREVDLGAGSGSPALPTAFTTAGEAFLLLRKAPDGSFVRQMEIIRRAHQSLDAKESALFTELVTAQYQANPYDSREILWHGYTLLVFSQSTRAPTLLKVVEDRTRTAESALAYAVALSDAETLENRQPNDFSKGRMKAAWAIFDARARLKRKPNESLAESLARVTAALAQTPALAKAFDDPSPRMPASTSRLPEASRP